MAKYHKTGKYGEMVYCWKERGGDIETWHISFIPAITVTCKPPYVVGVPDSCYLTCNPKIGGYPNLDDAESVGKFLGMRVLPLENGTQEAIQ